MIYLQDLNSIIHKHIEQTINKENLLRTILNVDNFGYNNYLPIYDISNTMYITYIENNNIISKRLNSNRFKLPMTEFSIEAYITNEVNLMSNEVNLMSNDLEYICNEIEKTFKKRDNHIAADLLKAAVNSANNIIPIYKDISQNEFSKLLYEIKYNTLYNDLKMKYIIMHPEFYYNIIEYKYSNCINKYEILLDDAVPFGIIYTTVEKEYMGVVTLYNSRTKIINNTLKYSTMCGGAIFGLNKVYCIYFGNYVNNHQSARRAHPSQSEQYTLTY